MYHETPNPASYDERTQFHTVTGHRAVEVVRIPSYSVWEQGKCLYINLEDTYLKIPEWIFSIFPCSIQGDIEGNPSYYPKSL